MKAIPIAAAAQQPEFQKSSIALLYPHSRISSAHFHMYRSQAGSAKAWASTDGANVRAQVDFHDASNKGAGVVPREIESVKLG